MSGEKPLLPIDIRQHTSGKEQPAAVVIVVIRVARAEAGLTDKAGGMDETPVAHIERHMHHTLRTAPVAPGAEEEQVARHEVGKVGGNLKALSGACLLRRIAGDDDIVKVEGGAHESAAIHALG